MKEIVFDASTLILLAKITALKKTVEKGKAIISLDVEEESTIKENLFDAKIIKNLLKGGLIKIENVKLNKKIMEDFNLDKGETTALSLAKEKNILLGTDDGPTIKACKILDIKFATAVHFLLRLVKENEISGEIAKEKLMLLEKYGRYNSQIIKNAIERIGGQK